MLGWSELRPGPVGLGCSHSTSFYASSDISGARGESREDVYEII